MQEAAKSLREALDTACQTGLTHRMQELQELGISRDGIESLALEPDHREEGRQLGKQLMELPVHGEIEAVKIEPFGRHARFQANGRLAQQRSADLAVGLTAKTLGAETAGAGAPFADLQARGADVPFVEENRSALEKLRRFEDRCVEDRG